MRKLVFYWENFGPMHDDRISAVAQAFPERSVVGLQRTSASTVYAWKTENKTEFVKKTIFPSGILPSTVRQVIGLTTAAMSEGRRSDVFLCNYNEIPTLVCAAVLRLSGRQVFVMGDSKFDDYPRYLWREVLKSIFLLPYNGAISSGRRHKEYLRFQGVRKIVGEYNTLSVARIREMSATPAAPDGVPFSERPFLCVARLVPKKNLQVLLSAYALYRAGVQVPRRLVICGNGPLEEALKRHARSLGIAEFVDFLGFVQIDEISRLMGRSLALLLPSVEEQFGNVVIEAQAVGLPVVVSDNVGARDIMVRSGVNGFVVEADNAEGLAYFMTELSEREELWQRMATNASSFAQNGDVARFVEGIQELIR